MCIVHSYSFKINKCLLELNVLNHCVKLPVKIKTVASVLNPDQSSETMLFTCNVL